mmetsp:Transcript_25851/g.73537  ORF Transcript_25851/g.73537 Transcript_25851/m.73537 type:complete len:220 (-) Transcript_25851:15-674(-)
MGAISISHGSLRGGVTTIGRRKTYKPGGSRRPGGGAGRSARSSNQQGQPGNKSDCFDVCPQASQGGAAARASCCSRAERGERGMTGKSLLPMSISIAGAWGKPRGDPTRAASAAAEDNKMAITASTCQQATARGKTTDAAPVAVRHRSGCRPLPGGMRPCLARWLLSGVPTSPGARPPKFATRQRRPLEPGTRRAGGGRGRMGPRAREGGPCARKRPCA